MRRLLLAGTAAISLTACQAAYIPAALPSSAPPGQTIAPTTMSQPFRFLTHCGILTTYFSGRTFYLEELYPARVRLASNLGDARGTITMITPHIAEFIDVEGNRIRFVDWLPGELNHPYPFTARVISGTNQLADEPFAGRWWQTRDTLPGVVGPPYGNGQDRFTTVSGTLTLIDESHAVFKSASGAVARYTVRPPMGCD